MSASCTPMRATEKTSLTSTILVGAMGLRTCALPPQNSNLLEDATVIVLNCSFPSLVLIGRR